MQSSQARSNSTERMRREVERQKQDRVAIPTTSANAQMEDVEETFDEVGEMVRGSGKRQMQIFHYERAIDDVVDNSVFDLWLILAHLK